MSNALYLVLAVLGTIFFMTGCVFLAFDWKTKARWSVGYTLFILGASLQMLTDFINQETVLFLILLIVYPLILVWYMRMFDPKYKEVKLVPTWRVALTCFYMAVTIFGVIMLDPKYPVYINMTIIGFVGMVIAGWPVWKKILN